MKNKPSAVKTIISYKKEIDDALERLIVLSNEHFNINPERANWEDVNFIGQLSELLINTTDYAFREGLFSPQQGVRNETLN